MSARRPHLYTIPISHYGERARWALDHAGVEYEELHHLQMFSWVAAYAVGGGKTLPVLTTGDEVLRDSADIVAWASARSAAPLLPVESRAKEEVRGLEERFAGDFGVETRRVVYEWFFRAGPNVRPCNLGRAPWIEASTLRFGFPFARAIGSRYLDASAQRAANGRDVVNRELDRVATLLSDGRRYLTGDRFTAADLTFAAMAAPCILPDRYPVTLPRLEEIPDDARDRVLAWRAHPAGAFAGRLYDERPIPRGIYRRPLRVPPRVPALPV